MVENLSFSVIIVTWNALDHLKTFLPSVTKTDYPDFEIIIADNASTDGSSEWVKTHCPECKIITYDNNFGYAGGNNKAVKYARGDILVFLNNDVKVDSYWLRGLQRAFQNRKVSLVQPKILSYQQPEYFEYAGAAGGLIDRLGYPFCRGRLFDQVEQDHGQYNEPASIFWASGAALAIRKELFVESGGFDEDFEFHMEEIDLCWRCHKLGASVSYEPESVVYHLGGGSLPAGSPRKIFYNFRNSLLMLTKNLDRRVLPKILLRLLLDGAAGIQMLLSGKPSHTLAVIRAHFAFYMMLPAALKKRKELKKKGTLPTPRNLVYGGLVVVDYVLKGKTTYRELFHD